MVWNILFFKNVSGKEIVKNFIRPLEKNTISKVSRYIDILRDKGPFLAMPYSKKISDGLWELRIGGRQNIRIFYTFNGDSIYLLHIFKKKSQKTPLKEIKTAMERQRHLT